MSRDPARSRYFIIVFARIFGVVITVVGLMALSGNMASVPRLAGAIMLIVGMMQMALVPIWLARRWRTPPMENEDRI